MKAVKYIQAGFRKRNPAFVYKLFPALFFLFITSFATVKPSLADPPVFFHKKNITLEKISPREIGLLVNSSLAISEGEIDLNINAEGSAVDYPEMTIGQGYTISTVIRRIEGLWERKILKNKNEDKPYITAEYTVTGTNGQKNALSHSSDPSDTINVRIQPLPLSWEEKNNQWICTANIELVMELADIEKSGNYEGTIQTLISIASF